MFMVYPHTILHMPGSSVSLAIATKLTQEMFAQLSCCHFTVFKNFALTKFAYFTRSIAIHHFVTRK